MSCVSFNNENEMVTKNQLIDMAEVFCKKYRSRKITHLKSCINKTFKDVKSISIVDLEVLWRTAGGDMSWHTKSCFAHGWVKKYSVSKSIRLYCYCDSDAMLYGFGSFIRTTLNIRLKSFTSMDTQYTKEDVLEIAKRFNRSGNMYSFSMLKFCINKVFTDKKTLTYTNLYHAFKLNRTDISWHDGQCYLVGLMHNNKLTKGRWEFCDCRVFDMLEDFLVWLEI